jgi:glycosyltransferase involved in cell wall biosynthesis
MDLRRPLTVVHILPRLDSGEVEHRTLEIAAELARRKQRCIVISAPGRLVPHLTVRGGEHIAWPLATKPLFSYPYVLKLRRLLERERPDVLHARGLWTAWIAYRAWRGMDAGRRPHLVTTAHDFYPVKRYSRVVTYGERVIAVSGAVKQYLLEHFPGVAEEKIHVIYRGVDERTFPHGYRPDIHWLQEWYRQYPQIIDRRLITLPGALVPTKGHYDFIELMNRLRQRGMEAYGLIVGGEQPGAEQYAKDLRSYVTLQGMDNILLTGYRQDVRNILSVSNLVVSLAARPEVFGRGVLESLQLGVPVVGYDHGGVGELLAAIFPEGRSPAGDMDKLVDTAARILSHPPQIEPHPEYRLSRMLDQTIDVYQQLCVGTGAPA